MLNIPRRAACGDAHCVDAGLQLQAPFHVLRTRGDERANRRIAHAKKSFRIALCEICPEIEIELGLHAPALHEFHHVSHRRAMAAPRLAAGLVVNVADGAEFMATGKIAGVPVRIRFPIPIRPRFH